MIIPAIDIYNGNCVRLKRGKYSDRVTFCKNPIKVLLFFLNKRVKRLHIIDLNGAQNNSLLNKRIVFCLFKVCNYFNSSKIQFGGGIRCLKKIKVYSYFFYKIIVSTVFFRRIFFLKYFFKKIIVSLDVKNNFVYSRGWKKKEFNLEKLKSYSLPKEIIYTDIYNDGTLNGINYKAIFKFSKIFKCNIIISGGMNKHSDIIKKKNFVGYISGISIYKKKLSIKYAL
ncbi:HisA/HisF-related TIM barrel protein [Candidatus Vidania fulgoroideorum]